MFFLVTVTDLGNMPYEELIHFIAKGDTIEDIQTIVTADDYILTVANKQWPGTTLERGNIVIYPLSCLDEVCELLSKTKEDCYTVLSDVHIHVGRTGIVKTEGEINAED